MTPTMNGINNHIPMNGTNINRSNPAGSDSVLIEDPNSIQFCTILDDRLEDITEHQQQHYYPIQSLHNHNRIYPYTINTSNNTINNTADTANNSTISRSTLSQLLLDILSSGPSIGLLSVCYTILLYRSIGYSLITVLYPISINLLFCSLFSGSKYSIYLPSTTILPLILSILKQYNNDYNLLIIIQLTASIVLLLLSFCRFGSKYLSTVPSSIITGLITGLTLYTGILQLPILTGLNNNNIINNNNNINTIPVDDITDLSSEWNNIQFQSIKLFLTICSSVSEWDWYTICISISTILLLILFQRLIRFLPAAVLAITTITIVNYITTNNNISTAATGSHSIDYIYSNTNNDNNQQYSINFQFPQFVNGFTIITSNLTSILYFLYYILNLSLTIGLESLLICRIADRLSNNRGHLFNSNKELLSIAVNNTINSLLTVPIPITVNYNLTITNIFSGSISPISSFIAAILSLIIINSIQSIGSIIPTATISAVLFYYTISAIRLQDYRELSGISNWFHCLLATYTAIIVLLFNSTIFAVLSAQLIFNLFAPRTDNRNNLITANNSLIIDNNNEQRPLLSLNNDYKAINYSG